MAPVFYFIDGTVGAKKYQSRATSFFEAIQEIRKLRRSEMDGAPDMQIVRFDMLPHHLKSLWPRKITYHV